MRVRFDLWRSVCLGALWKLSDLLKVPCRLLRVFCCGSLAGKWTWICRSVVCAWNEGIPDSLPFVELYGSEGVVAWILLMPCTGQEDKDKHFMYAFPAGFLTLVSCPQGSLSQCSYEKKMAQRCCDTSSWTCWVAGRLKMCIVKFPCCTLFIGLVFPRVVCQMLLNIYCLWNIISNFIPGFKSPLSSKNAKQVCGYTNKLNVEIRFIKYSSGPKILVQV